MLCDFSLSAVNGNDVQSSVIMEKYKVGKVIGDGNFAVVRECMERYLTNVLKYDI